MIVQVLASLVTLYVLKRNTRILLLLFTVTCINPVEISRGNVAFNYRPIYNT
jgi:hypothetical protein